MRQFLLFITIIAVGLLFIARLFYLQIYNSSGHDLYEDNAIRKVYDYPKRGFVYDRNGELLVANQPSYDVMVIPREVEPLDTLEFCELLKIDKSQFIKKYEKARHYSPRLPSVFVSHLSKEDYAVLQEKMRKFQGFYIQKRSLRDYETTIGANVLGDIGEVNNGDIRRDPYYKMGDLKGKQGIEASYEKTLRGVKGIKFIQKDRFNKNIGPYKGGKFDTIPEQGKDITITIDAQLQAYGELLMQNKRGGVIAIEPATGEILSMVAAPTYDPNLLVGRDRSKNFTKLYNDSIAKPLFNRSLQGVYEPGSPFKLMNALIALQEGVVTPEETVTCYAGYKYGNRFMKCHCHRGTRNDMIGGIQRSCNAYFATTYRKILDKNGNASEGIDNWSKHAQSFGLGNFLNNDLFVGQKGRIPDRAYYKTIYPNTFYSTYTISNAIGQGEVATTPIQLANMAAAIANRGYYFTPHIIKNIEGETLPEQFTQPKYTTIDRDNFEPVIEGMLQVYKKGTAASLQIKDIDICGKTGTVENFVKIDSVKTQLTDHSIFLAFAPKNNPKIAIAVFVENGYWGSRFAGRIASLMIEKHIKGHTTRKDMEDWLLRHTLENEYAKPFSGESFGINGYTTLQIVEEQEYYRLKKELNRINKAES
ncbi:penicillin-binding protein 2 [Algibacter amylolyticus]|uniref:Penicillin-binding protein 2 n=1 Tax=Algibacter amylolyticus TaxID=1608400 RepID=A0A5M7BDH2_9FLAO|nr:penicillin-binding protein 2 [Algibacter amylolyticus]KAA5826297.1 penicillin-binding protein 2 [Algibacter amylolyticus]MBB5268500.1 penicillin-binding protein 2 [Algibacter amylolyticus]TSJ80335.1 penicillin-binding protein 2 [Algibacter amylolyticus]